MHPYLRGKDLALFAWTPPRHARSENAWSAARHFALPNGTALPEFDRFGLFAWDEALTRVGKNMARILAGISRRDMPKRRFEMMRRSC